MPVFCDCICEEDNLPSARLYTRNLSASKVLLVTLI